MLRLLAYTLLLIALSTASFAGEADTNFANKPEVKAFINKMVKEYHFDKAMLISLFNTVIPRPIIIHAHKNQREQEQPWFLYERSFVNEWRIQHGLAFWNKHAKVLSEAEKKYGVPASIIVATLGVETRYGTKMGGYEVFNALSNVAFTPTSRGRFFLRELEQLLLFAKENHFNPKKIKGSYAGAFGQPQFMPSSYRAYAVSYSGTTAPDLIHNANDAIFSVANYYKKHGWKSKEPVAIPATVTKPQYLAELKRIRIPTSELKKYGVQAKSPIPKGEYQVKLIELKGFVKNEYWLSFYNFKVIKRYNASNHYAMAVYELSHYIASLRSKLNHG